MLLRRLSLSLACATGLVAAVALAVNAIEPREERLGDSIVGLVRWTGGPPPPATSVANTTDPQVCGALHAKGEVRLDEQGGVADAIVRLVDAPPLATRGAPRRRLLDNRGCRFEPPASTLTSGDTLIARNLDPTLHTVHIYGPEERNVSLPLKDVEVPVTLDQPGLYTIKCDVHGWMEGFLRVEPHPWHAVTDSRGAFRIPAVPPGRYTLEAWHPRAKARQAVVDIRAGETASVELTLSAYP